MSGAKLSVSAGLGVGIAFALQGLFAIALLRFFPAQEVGVFSAVSQIAFFWMTLALAQAPLHWMVNASGASGHSLRQAVIEAAQRFLLIFPVIALALVFLDRSSYWETLLWALILGAGQIGWQWAQSALLRYGTAQHVFLNRIVPPLSALLGSSASAAMLHKSSRLALLLAAAGGYWVGALWLVPSLLKADSVAVPEVARPQEDDRSVALRFWHTFMDALPMLVLLLVWKASYGDADTGYLGVCLRLLGFAPTLVYTAWAQVQLARGRSAAAQPIHVALTGMLLVLALGWGSDAMARWGWIHGSWTALRSYLVPIMLWQAAACVLAATSHMPFHSSTASHFSRLAIAFNVVLTCLILLPWTVGAHWSAELHLWIIAVYAALALCGMGAINYRNLQRSNNA